ncbi:MAG: hypothetical protein M1819_005458 [Sarea resinae]|nr:MAG: hypothetical protein M1819_005458 [Sarea resinae]
MATIFGPAPPGVNLNASQTARDNVAVIVVTAIATISVLLRLWARSVQRLALVADDYLVIVALVFVYSSAGISIASGYYGAGRHMLYAYTFIYGASVAFTKLSVICFYRRVFGTADRVFNWALYISFSVSVCYILMIWTVMLGSCQPLSYFWNQYVDPKAQGSCIAVNKFFLIAGCINMVIDVCILIIPIPKIYQLQMSRRRKLTVVGIMMLGGFVCVASIVRIYYLVRLQTQIDLTWIMGSVFIWSSVEPSIGILSACLPVLRPLLRIVFRGYFNHSNKHTTSHDLEPTTGWQRFKGNKSHVTSRSQAGHGFTGKLRPEDDEVMLTNDVTSSGIYDDRMDHGGGKGNNDKSIVVETYVSQTTTSANEGV